MHKVEIGPATLFRGDCIKIIPMIKADAVVTDPPYGINYHHRGNKKSKVRINTMRIIGDDQPFDPRPLLRFKKVLMFGADHYAPRLPEKKGEWLVWDKSCGTGPNDLFRDAEFIWMSGKSARLIFRHVWKGMIREGEEASSRMERLHVSQKPVALMMWCISQLRVRVGATILDPYMGSGTTGIAALRTGRRFVGIEKDPGIFQTAVDRIRAEWQAMMN